MCGILAYIGREPAAPLLVRLLKKLEYRGYDSAGIATVTDSAIHMAKDVGRVDEIASHLDLTSLSGFGGIAHTRWATHGGVTPENAHPHLSCDGRIAIVHNGIIDNYKKLREELENRNHSFRSGTDSEILAHLLEEPPVLGLLLGAFGAALVPTPLPHERHHRNSGEHEGDGEDPCA